MSYTIDKLNEVEFFLNKLKEHKGEFPEYNYYLNAFVGSARSVLWIMKSEYSSNKEWERWYKEKSTTESEDRLLSGITNMRNRSLKQGPLKVEQFNIISLKNESVDVMEEIKKFVKKHGEDRKYTISIESNIDKKDRVLVIDDDTLNIHGELNIYYTVKEFKECNILDKCIEYYSWLKSMVEECDTLFN